MEPLVCTKNMKPSNYDNSLIHTAPKPTLNTPLEPNFFGVNRVPLKQQSGIICIHLATNMYRSFSPSDEGEGEGGEKAPRLYNDDDVNRTLCKR